jgi:hypothetical protein
MLAIPVWRYHKQDDWFRDLVSRCIVYFTGYDYTHVGIYFEGKLYESTVWKNEKGKLCSGIRITVKGDPTVPSPDICMVPWRLEITPERLDRLGQTLARYVAAGRPYNVFKMLVLAFVWPTRWFWKKIKWVPFNHEVFGEVCSGFVDEVMYKSRWDLFPEEWEGYTVPGQFLRIPGWRADSCSDI